MRGVLLGLNALTAGRMRLLGVCIAGSLALNISALCASLKVLIEDGDCLCDYKDNA